jgi:Uma2 family endonuclease
VRFPLAAPTPPGFDPEDPSTWPDFPGRWEFVGGRLLFTPPCGDEQADVVVGVLWAFQPWADRHPEFVVGGNEAGMILGGETRGADAAVWRRDQVGPATGKYRRVPPVLAVEVAGADEGEAELREKGRWYLSNGVAVVWVVLPETREVVVLTSDGESRHGRDHHLPQVPELPDLQPSVASIFRQLDAT